MFNVVIGAGQNADGSLVVFSTGYCTGTVFTLSLGRMSSSIKPLGKLKQFAVGRDADGRIDAFALTVEGKCHRILENGPYAGIYSATDIGAVGWRQIALARNLDGRLELFALVDGNVWHLYQEAPNGNWTSSQSFGTNGVEQIAVASNKDGRLEVFALASGNVWHFWQTSPGGGWSPSESFGTNGLEQIAVASNEDGRLEVFALASGNVWHFWQTSPGGGWSPSESFGTNGVKQIAVEKESGQLSVIAAAEESVWLFRQKTTTPGGAWSASIQITMEFRLGISLSVSPDTIVEGEATQLTWSTSRDLESAYLEGFGEVSANGKLTNGHVTIFPKASQDFIITARLGDCVAEATAHVTVNPKESGPGESSPAEFTIWLAQEGVYEGAGGGEFLDAVHRRFAS
jgi:hypothetical protein